MNNADEQQGLKSLCRVYFNTTSTCDTSQDEKKNNAVGIPIQGFRVTTRDTTVKIPLGGPCVRVRACVCVHVREREI